MTSRGITAETQERFQLGSDPRGRLTIPYLTPAGPLIVKYRCLTDHDCKEEGHGKYSNDPGAATYLYNAQTLIDADAVIVCEGELDAVAAEQAGVPAVAYPGTSTWAKHRHWRYCFDSVGEVVVMADGDKPGRDAAGTVAASLRDVVDDVRVVELPDGSDVNSFINDYGDGAFLAEIGWL